MENEKMCRGCNKFLSLCKFYKTRKTTENLCKNCRNKQTSERRKLNPQKYKYNKKYQQKTIECRRKKRKEIKDKYGLGSGTVMRFGFELALKVYEKCERKCVQCGEINGLVIHHLDRNGRNLENIGLKPNNNIDNLIVLCRSCHGKIHGKEGGKMHGKNYKK